MQYDYLSVDVAAGVLRVTIDRPEKRNALSSDVLRELLGVMSHYAGDDSLLAAVLTGAGQKCFAAGGDLQEFDSLRAEADAVRMGREASATLDSIRDFPVPVIGALNGDAIGGGAELAMSCDLRIFAQHARIAFVQGLLNIAPAWGGGTDLMRVAGSANALRLLASSEFISAGEALRLGIAQLVAAADETITAAVEKFLTPVRTKKPQVMRAFKALAVAARNGDDRAMVRDLEHRLLVETWCHQDHWDAHDRVLARISE